MIEARWKIENGGFRFVSVTDRLSGKTVQADIPFSVELEAGATVPADRMVITAGPRIKKLEPSKNAAVFSRRAGGKAIRIDLEEKETGLKAVWQGILRDGSGYIRQEVTFTSSKPGMRLANIILLDVQAPGMGAKVSGDVQGSPAVTGTMFFGIEHPLSESSVTDGDNARRLCSFGQNIGLDSEKGFTISSVIGVVPGARCGADFSVTWNVSGRTPTVSTSITTVGMT